MTNNRSRKRNYRRAFRDLRSDIGDLGGCMNTKSRNSKLNKRAVARKVRQYLADFHLGGITLEVLDEGVRGEESWWYVPVRPSAEPVKRYEYYEALADVEGGLEEKEKLTVVLMPG